MAGHISDAVREQLSKLGSDKKARVIEVADERRHATDSLSGRPAVGQPAVTRKDVGAA